MFASPLILAAALAPGSFQVELRGREVVASAEARDALVADVARRLEELLQLPVRASKALAAARVSFRKLEDVPLEELLLRLAPVVYADTRESLAAEPRLLALHLAEAGSPGPVAPSAVIAVSGGDAGVAEPEPPPDGPFLRVKLGQDGRFSVDAREQGLGVLLYEIAQLYGARFDFRLVEAPTVERFTASDILPSELPALLPYGGVSLELRRNVGSREETLLRCVVEPPHRAETQGAGRDPVDDREEGLRGTTHRRREGARGSGPGLPADAADRVVGHERPQQRRRR